MNRETGKVPGSLAGHAVITGDVHTTVRFVLGKLRVTESSELYGVQYSVLCTLLYSTEYKKRHR